MKEEAIVVCAFVLASWLNFVMSYRFDFRCYQRQFREPLVTSQGNWQQREGIILRLTHKTGSVGWGEIAPLPSFGSETLEQALTCCQQFANEVTEEAIASISDTLPACQFGFGSALENLTAPTNFPNDLSYSCLLPAGEEALHTWQAAWEAGDTTFKWKIGVLPLHTELSLFKKLIEALPTTAKLRLDANGGFTVEAAREWLRQCEDTNIIEYLEQPISPQHFETMLTLSQDYSTPLALDESVATLAQMEQYYEKGWRGIFIVKAAIAGFPDRLRQFCRTHSLNTVFSSVLETRIGRTAALNLARELQPRDRAVGFGVTHWFQEADDTWLKQLWQ